jgi:integrase
VAGAEKDRSPAGDHRGWHEGTVYWDRAKGRYRGAIMLDWKRVQAYGATEREVRQKLAEARRRHARGLPNPARAARQTVRAYLTAWLETKRGLREGAYLRLKSDVTNHLLPELGRHALNALQPHHVRALYASLQSRGYAANSVRNVHRTLAQALKQAVKDSLLERNVADLAADALPPPPVRRLRALSREQTSRFLDATAGHRLEQLFRLNCETGCRIGELLGLTWDHVDLGLGRRGAIWIERQLTRPRNRAPTFAAPKTAAGLRPVFLTSRARAALEAQRRTQEVERRRWQDDARQVDHGLVFASKFGAPVHHSNVARAFERLAKAASLPGDATPHWLRHTAGTRMAERGVEVSTIAAVLGHADAGFTARTYLHALHDRRREAAERLEGLYNDPATLSGGEEAATRETEPRAPNE